ncbi:MAG: alpha-L-fucosidase [Planctomycetes bacterium]|nr:alpha-L-fucosidase [Planctomycetota bacterium]
MRTRRPLRTTSLALAFLASAWLGGCGPTKPVKHPWTPPDPKGPAGPDEAREVERDDWWREARFGLFVHWGLYALTEGRSGERDDYGEWIRDTARIPEREYRALAERFDARGFEPRAWARLAREAGMRYVVFTAKHHDGFCLFDSEHTTFDSQGSAAQRDLTLEVVEAFRSEGLRVGLYYSILDWDHPDYLPRRAWDERPAEDADFLRYEAYLRAQVKELLTRYGAIDLLWFDGQWEGTWSHASGLALHELCRELRPAILVNNRVDKGRAEDGSTTPGFAGDFATPEQVVPGEALEGPWETCLTMNSHWGWNAADAQWKSTRELVRTLIDVASKGGNLLLNVGPRGDGSFPPQAVERLQQIGAWMAQNSESIRGTEASPIGAFPWGRATWKPREKGGTLYLHVFDWPENGVLRVPGVGNRDNLRVRVLADTTLKPRMQVENDGLVLRLPLRDADPAALSLTIAIEIGEEPIFHRAPLVYAPSQVFVDPIEVRIAPGSPKLRVRYTLDGSEPTASSLFYEGPFELTTSAELRARNFQDGRPVGPVTQRRFVREELRPPVEPTNLEPGLWLRREARELAALPPLGTEPSGAPEPALSIAIDGGADHEKLWMRWEGFLEIPKSGVWRFALRSDDGSRLALGRSVIVDNDGLHGVQIKEGAAALAAGLHPVTIEWFNATGTADVNLSVAPPGGDFAPATAELFRRFKL